MIDAATAAEDLVTLRAYLDHPNIVARVYASRKYNALRAKIEQV